MAVHHEKHKTNKIVISALILVCISIFSFVNRDVFQMFPFQNAYAFAGPSNIFTGRNGNLYLIDKAKKKIVIADSDADYIGELNGGSLKDAFYYASLVCDDADGNIYVADVVYNGRGTQLGAERILKFDAEGKYVDVLFEQTYEEADAPFQYGNIVELKEKDGELQFLLLRNGAIDCCTLSVTGGEPDVVRWNADYDFSDAAYDSVQERMIITTRQGDMLALDKNGKEEVLFKGNGTEIPWNVTVDKYGQIYFTELTSRGVYAWQASGLQELVKSDYSYYTVQIDDAGRLVTTDYSGICIYENGETKYLEQFHIRNLPYRYMVWILAIAGGIYLLYLMIRLLVYLIRKAGKPEQVIRIVMILAASILCSVTIIAMLWNSMSENQKNTMLQELTLFATMMTREIDGDKVCRISQANDYKSDLYNEIKEPLDQMINTGYEVGTYYYYILYFNDGSFFNACMDYEETMTINYPAYEWGDNIYTECIVDREMKQSPGEASAYGTWTFVLEPIMDAEGNAVAMLEVGANMDEIERQQRELFVQVLFTTGTAVIVIIMLLMEILFLLGDRKAAKEDPANPTQYAPVRMTIFLLYLADSLQDAFIVQLCYRLYDNSLPLPEGIACSLPISAELFMAAVFSLIAGRIVSKIGTKRNLVMGTILCMAGFLLCGGWSSYYMLLIGKILVGMGMGIVYVAANTLAAKGRNEEECGKAFAGISAGVLSGITVGDGLGSIILSFASYRVVYIAAGIIMLAAVLLMFRSRDMRPSVEKERSAIRLPRFLFNWRVLPFFLLLLLPFMIMLSYREYFFPLFAEENGMNEVAIGRLFLICGLIVIYIGPALGEFLIHRLGSRRSVILASSMMFVNVLIFMLYPSFASAVLGVVILSINISFAYTCQYAYFASLPECDSYGEGNAMGIYSMIENVGQTVGPLIFGAAMVLGYRIGIIVIGIGFGVLLLLFLFTLFAGRRQANKGL